jgi:hypothetical protein
LRGRFLDVVASAGFRRSPPYSPILHNIRSATFSVSSLGEIIAELKAIAAWPGEHEGLTRSACFAFLSVGFEHRQSCNCHIHIVPSSPLPP